MLRSKSGNVFEHKALYRSLKAEVPEGYYELALGKADFISRGKDLSIITYGLGVHWATSLLKKYPDIDATLLDLQTLLPLDTESIYEAVENTGKVLILHEDTMFAGIGGEISALISENCFQYLDAPVMRCASLDTPVPFNRNLEEQFLANARLEEKFHKLMEF